MDRRHLIRLLGTTAAFAGWTPLELDALFRPGGTVRAGVGFLTLEQREALTAFADRIIPTTDTPGAVDAGAVEFIEVLLSELYDVVSRERLLRGLAHLDQHAVAMTGLRFAHAGEAVQTAILEGLQAEGNALRDAARDDEDVPASFFHEARGLVLEGYYTSRVGMLEESRFVPIPGRFDGAAPLSEVIRGSDP
jgi:gluconate 2-dehydrogenase gamma chain